MNGNPNYALNDAYQEIQQEHVQIGMPVMIAPPTGAPPMPPTGAPPMPPTGAPPKLPQYDQSPLFETQIEADSMIDPYTCPINDLTLVGNQAWHMIRSEAMDPDYKQTTWHKDLRPSHLILLERLREAQLAQDDWNPLPGRQGLQEPLIDQHCEEPDQTDQEQPWNVQAKHDAEEVQNQSSVSSEYLHRNDSIEIPNYDRETR